MVARGGGLAKGKRLVVMEYDRARVLAKLKQKEHDDIYERGRGAAG